MTTLSESYQDMVRALRQPERGRWPSDCFAPLADCFEEMGLDLKSKFARAGHWVHGRAATPYTHWYWEVVVSHQEADTADDRYAFQAVPYELLYWVAGLDPVFVNLGTGEPGIMRRHRLLTVNMLAADPGCLWTWVGGPESDQAEDSLHHFLPDEMLSEVPWSRITAAEAMRPITRAQAWMEREWHDFLDRLLRSRATRSKPPIFHRDLRHYYCHCRSGEVECVEPREARSLGRGPRVLKENL